jgi:DNA-binding response OmpR family regulator
VPSDILTPRRGSQSNHGTPVRPGRVLLLEDEAALREVLAEALLGEGYQVETSRTFAELYRAAAERRGDLALADFWGPSQLVLTDEDLAQLARLTRLLPVVLMTARCWADALTAEQLGALALVRKPFELEELLATVGVAVRESPRHPATPAGTRSSRR